jgi:predicted homoserine dehydrogenase-like protein
MRPTEAGGNLFHAGTVEVAASLSSDGGPVARPLDHGVFVSFAVPDDAARRELEAAGLPCDERGAYAALYRPALLGGLELLISVLRVGLRGLPTGRPRHLRGDVVAVARTDLPEGQVLDGAGGNTVYGVLLPAAIALAQGCLPIGLAQAVALRHPVAAGQTLRWDDVFYEPTNPTVRIRRLMERTMGPGS